MMANLKNVDVSNGRDGKRGFFRLLRIAYDERRGLAEVDPKRCAAVVDVGGAIDGPSRRDDRNNTQDIIQSQHVGRSKAAGIHNRHSSP